ncbi:protease IV [Glaciecola punicea ACAM 611]|jgi:protease-4|uniref:Protease IV n=1 Tax=Glaciecola punicea ACAM 611 TaxID=1121923 RepID=H5T901_9ALTE|nr:signal peptide peptidase SppA [Glaciecola punicea]OFA31665.1 signal peptide peptidase SppA [Glaciecola punicea]GAB54778.1 protease IV [Glaciecola punicea ACAM 611]
MSGKSSFTKSLFVGIWNGLNFGRRLLLNILFLIIIIAIVVGISTSGSQKPVVAKNSALMLNLSGNLVIQKTWVDPAELFISQITGQGQDEQEILLRDLINVIENAAKDERIGAIVLDLDGFGGGGMDKLKQVGEALQAFKTSGKPIYAIGDYFGRAQYYLASHADNVYVHPMGALLMEGYTRYGTYFAEALEKLKVSTHVFKVGKFKSAVEPYLRNTMSPEAKLANEAWLNEMWSMFKADVAASRGFDEQNFDETFDELLTKFSAVNGDFAQYALANNWVDGLRTRAQFRSELVELLGAAKEGETFNQVSYKAYSKLLKPAFPRSNHSGGDKVAVIVAKGNIMDGKQDPGAIGGDSTAQLLRKARNNDSVKAVVLQVDSGGGSAFASEVIRQEVELLKAAGKPVVASMSSVAASGGYWISVSANRIFAEPSTITGSIGIFGLLATFENSFNYLGVNSDGVSTNELVGMSVNRPLAEGYKALLQMNIERGYERFITLVAQERGMTLEEVDNVAQGRVWLGTQALELGLVDELGGLEEAVAYAAQLAELEDFSQIYLQRELSDDEKMWANLLNNASALMSGLKINYKPSPLMQLAKQVEAQTAFMSKLNDPMATYAICIECTMVE